MELVTLILSLMLVVISILLLYKYGAERRRFVAMVNRIPGPYPLPIIGNILDVFMTPRNKFMELGNRHVKKYPDMYRTWNGPLELIHIFRPEHVEVFLSSMKHISKGWLYNYLHPWLGQGLLTSTGSKWQSHRKMITPTFHFKILETFFDIFVENGRVLVEKLQENVDSSGVKGFNVYPFITLCALDIICEFAMGVKIHAQEDVSSEYVQAVYDISEITLSRSFRPWLHFDFTFGLTKSGKRHRECLKILHGFTNKVIQERKAEQLKSPKNEDLQDQEEVLGAKKRKAFLDLLLQVSIDGKTLTDEEIREQVDTFMFEGHDTTTAAISWALFLVGGNPDVQEKVVEELDRIFHGLDRTITMQDCQEMKYLECVIKETMRLYPSVPFIMRTVEADTECGDYVLPEGSTALVHIYHTHRDVRHFPNPEKFDPDNFLPDRVQGRHPYAYIPFSAGPRNCIGQKFAMLEEKTILATIFRNFKLRSLERQEDINVLSELVLRPESGVQMVLSKR